MYASNVENVEKRFWGKLSIVLVQKNIFLDTCSLGALDTVRSNLRRVCTDRPKLQARS